MFVAARACQGAFGALLAPAALGLLTTTFSDQRARGKAFGVYGAIAASGGAVGLLLGGVLTEYLSWRWCLYVNLFFALVAALGAAALLRRQARPGWHGLDMLGVVTGGGAMFCLVYGFSNASIYTWHTPSTWGYLAAGAALLIVFAIREALARNPLLPPAIVTQRNRGGANLAVLAASAGMLGIFLFLTYYLQQNLGYTPVATGVAFLPMIGMVMVFANLANIALLPRTGPRPLVFAGLLAAAGATAWLTRIGPHVSYAHAVLGPILLAGAGFGFTIASAMNTGTFAVAARAAGVASATLNSMQQIGGSIGTSLLNTEATRATSAYIAAHASAASRGPGAKRAVVAAAQVHGFATAFWWSAAIFAGGAILAGALLRSGRPGARQTSRHVRGQVLQASGPPVPNATVTLADRGGQEAARAQTGPDGHYDLTPPGGGAYTLTVAAPAHHPAATAVLVEDQPVEVDVRLVTAELRGMVRTAAGTAIPDARVSLANGSGNIVGAAATGRTGSMSSDPSPTGGTRSPRVATRPHPNRSG